MQIDRSELCPFHCRCQEAAAEIERLRARLTLEFLTPVVDRLREDSSDGNWRRSEQFAQRLLDQVLAHEQSPRKQEAT